MTPYSGLLFFYLMVLLLLPAVILGLWEKSLKGYGLFFSTAMLAIVFGINGQLLQLAGFCLWQMELFLFFRWKRPKWFWLMVVLVLLPLALIKVGAVCRFPVTGRQLYDLPGGRDAHQSAGWDAFASQPVSVEFFSAVLPIGQLRTHRPLPPVPSGSGRASFPRGIHSPAAGGHLEAGGRSVLGYCPERADLAVLAGPSAGKRIFEYPFLYVRLYPVFVL